MPNRNKPKAPPKPKKIDQTEQRPGGLLCHTEEYDFYVGKRDFDFPREEEGDLGDLPYLPYQSRRDFIFPEWVCKPTITFELDDFQQGRTLEDLELEVTEKSGSLELEIFERGSVLLEIEEFIVTEKPIEAFQGRTLLEIEEFLVTNKNLEPESFHNGRLLEDVELIIPPRLPEDIVNFQNFNGSSLIVDNLNFSKIPITLEPESFVGRVFEEIQVFSEKFNCILYPETIPAITNFLSCSFINTPETIFDYYSPCCVGDSLWMGDSPYLYHEMSQKEYPNAEVFATGGRYLLVDELTTQINLTDIWAFNGRTFWLNEDDESVPLYNVNGFRGESLEVFFDWNRETNFCEIAQEWFGEDLVIELAELIDDSCKYEYLYQGRTLELNSLQTGFSFEADAYVGCQIDVELDVFTWLVNMYQGRELLPHIALDHIYEPEIGNGRELIVDFYEPPIEFFVGRELEVEINTRYYVEFMEYGCLDNEHIYTDAQGYRHDYLTIPAPVEFLPFKHWIKARCY